MLALEVVFAGVSSPPVLVFDEVDAGVGGQAATSIGQCLATLAKRHQVIVVTHLPQVAAFADTHLVVSKDTSGTVTTSGVRAVADVDRARELARMVLGVSLAVIVPLAVIVSHRVLARAHVAHTPP